MKIAILIWTVVYLFVVFAISLHHHTHITTESVEHKCHFKEKNHTHQNDSDQQLADHCSICFFVQQPYEYNCFIYLDIPEAISIKLFSLVGDINNLYCFDPLENSSNKDPPLYS